MTKTIGIVLFPDFEDLDAIGPKEVFGMFALTNREWQVVTVSQDGEPVRSFLGTTIHTDHSFEDCPSLDVILVPGGDGTRAEIQNPRMLEFVQEKGQGAQWVTSVCTGALVLAQAGFLTNRRATTYWAATSLLAAYPGVEVDDSARYVHDGNVISAAGVSAGIDMALYLVSLLTDGQTARNVQKMMEYYPKPPEFQGATA
ncbi:MAG TPA: DJ-1/PfpI family protein [Dehalococcoidia bacterium]